MTSSAPAALRIGGQDWTVQLRSLADRYGETAKRRLRITLARGQAPGHMRDTLLHEVLHAAWSVNPPLDDEDQEERVVAALAPWLLLALRDNPDLVAFLTAP